MAYFSVLLLLVMGKELVALRPVLQVVFLGIWAGYVSFQVVLSIVGGIKVNHTR